jgi:hypothetical protein
MQRLIEDMDLRAWLQESGLDSTAIRSEFDIQKAALAILPGVIATLRQNAENRAFVETLKQIPSLDQNQLRLDCRRNAEKAIDSDDILPLLIAAIRNRSQTGSSEASRNAERRAS